MSRREDDVLMTPSEAAQVLGLSADSVRSLSDGGRLPTLRTISGRRLFWRGDVQKLADERRAAGKRSSKPAVVATPAKGAGKPAPRTKR